MTEQQLKKIKAEKLKWLYRLLGSTVIAILTVVIVFLTTPVATSTLVSILVFMVLLGLIFYIKPRLMYASFKHKYVLLLYLSSKPYKVSETFDSRWINRILESGFKYFHQSDDFDVMFRISKGVEKNIFNVNNMLEIITIFKNNDIDFYSDDLHHVYKNLWIDHNQKGQINKQVILQIKKYDGISGDIVEKLNEVTLFNESKNYLITVNIGYFANNKTIYYLHSEKYNPNVYYKYACESIRSIIK